MIKKLAFGVLLVFLAGCAAGCDMRQAVSRMTLELKKVSISGVSDKGFNARLDIEISNPNWFGMRVVDFSYQVLVSGQELARGRVTDEIKVPGNGSVVAGLPVEVTYGDLRGRIADIIRGRMEYEVKGEVVFRAWFATYTLPFDTIKKPRRDIGPEAVPTPPSLPGEPPGSPATVAPPRTESL